MNYMACLDLLSELGEWNISSGHKVMDYKCGCAYPHLGCRRVNLLKGGIWGKVDVTCSIVGNVGITEWNDGRVGGGGNKTNNGG